ncbi:OprD family porin [Photobacterium sp. SDRW27]|uniref:OprD family outer membrane porin n=1 Tax=Photobacterium obscurum TaxID=2829490 RepID=UPI002244DDE7|nr:OprD family outer membrane porin [Photobacterium obscurum]MCW8328145.1 OprD family porin [Photobacterium obscurum]
MENMFKRSVLSAVVVGIMAGSAVAVAPSAHASGFFEDSSINGAMNFMLRDRTRASFDAETGEDGPKRPNLDHGSIFTNLGFNSGYAGDVFGVDLNVYATYDMWQNASADHEFNFWNVDNPFGGTNPSTGDCLNAQGEEGSESKWNVDCNDNGISYQTVAAKFKLGEDGTAKLGYFQPSVPSAMGVNWSFAAGTYLGGEVGYKFGDLDLGAVYATRYKAPWFKDTYELQTTNGEDAGDAYSIGGRYTLANGLLFDAAYAGLTDGDRKNAHFKVKHTLDSGLYLSGQVYAVDDDEQFDSTAYQFAFLSAKSFGPYSLRGEATYTVAESVDENSMGNMAYRLTAQYGGSNGTYDIWWNNRSDFNHDGELAVFGSLSRDFNDLGAPGLNAGLSAAMGIASSDVAGLDDLTEYAGSVFVSYAIQNGALEGANVGFHYTEYVNDTDTDNWAGWTNLFQDETDIKVTLTIPYSIK